MSIALPGPCTIHLPLAVSWLGTDPEVPVGTDCLACGDLLVIHQPDINTPERLLGTCDSCGAWHLVDLDRAATVLLPDVDQLCNAEADR
jgi:hypothetical protein